MSRNLPSSRGTYRRLDQIDEAEIRRVLNASLMSVFHGCRAAVDEFRRTRHRGAIVNVSSIHPRFSFRRTPAYDAAKAGVEGLTRQLSVEYGQLGIRVNAVAPGYILARPDAPWLARDPCRRARTMTEWAATAPRGEVITPDEVAGPVAVLLSNDAAAITGHVLAVDGGLAAQAIQSPRDPNLDS